MNAMDGQACIRCGEGSSLVADYKGMVLGEAFPQCRYLCQKIGVIAGLGTEKCGLQQTHVTDTVGATVALNLVVAHGQHFDLGEVVCHFASCL